MEDRKEQEQQQEQRVPLATSKEEPKQETHSIRSEAQTQPAVGSRWIHGKQLTLTLLAFVAGAFGIFQWGQMIGKAGFDESNAVHLRQLQDATQGAANENKALQSELLVAQERTTTLDAQMALLRERLANSESQNSEMKEELMKRGVSLAELSRKNQELSASNKGVLELVQKDRPLFKFAATVKDARIVVRPKNISTIPGRITRAESRAWLDGHAGKIDDSDIVTIQQPGEDSFYLTFSALGGDTKPVILGSKDFRAAGCIEYETLTAGDNRKWVAEYWVIYDASDQSVSIRKENDFEVRSNSPRCNLDAQMPSGWIKEAKQKQDAAIGELVAEVASLAKSGNLQAALEKYSTFISSYSVSDVWPSSWNSLCWSGAVYGFAKEVLAACNNAVSGADSAHKINYLDSRGIARAMAGDRSGAMADLELVVKESGSHPEWQIYVPLRRTILDGLRRGVNPIDDEIKDRLSKE